MLTVLPRRTDGADAATAFVAIGSNLGDRRAMLRFAVEQLGDVTGLSGVYETAPVGGPEGSGPYLNMVVRLETTLDPFALLDVCLAIERRAGRERRVRWGPRTLDLDVLLHGQVCLDDARLTIPHPRMYERSFVLTPLADLAPELVPARAAHLVGGPGVTRVEDLW